MTLLVTLIGSVQGESSGTSTVIGKYQYSINAIQYTKKCRRLGCESKCRVLKRRTGSNFDFKYLGQVPAKVNRIPFFEP